VVEAGYVYDRCRGLAALERGENDWPRYTGEIFDDIGLPAEPISPSKVAGRLAGLRVLCLGREAPPVPPQRLARWVADGGVLVGFRTTGLDDLFGIAGDGPAAAAPPFSVVAWMDLDGRDEAANLRDPGLPQVPCPIMAPFRRVGLRGAVSLADLLSEGAPPAPPSCGTM